MPSFSLTLSSAGPIVDATVALDARGQRQIAVGHATSITMRLLLDTGSARTLLEEVMFPQAWILARRGPGPVANGYGGSSVPTYEYDLDFVVGGSSALPPWRPVTRTVCAAAPQPPTAAAPNGGSAKKLDYTGVIGRDLLALLDSFAYEGRSGRFSLHFP